MAGQFSLKLFPEAMMKCDKCLFVPPTDGSKHQKWKIISCCSLLTLGEPVHFFSILPTLCGMNEHRPKHGNYLAGKSLRSQIEVPWICNYLYVVRPWKPLWIIYNKHCNKTPLYSVEVPRGVTDRLCFIVPEAGWRAMAWWLDWGFCRISSKLTTLVCFQSTYHHFWPVEETGVPGGNLSRLWTMEL